MFSCFVIFHVQLDIFSIKVFLILSIMFLVCDHDTSLILLKFLFWFTAAGTGIL